jgi:acetylxylan esterase
MHIQTLAASLALASGALAAQLTQVSNYGGSARAKPGMYVVTTLLLHTANTTPKVGICTRPSQE